MKPGKLLFSIELPYQSKLFQPLADLGTREYSKKKKVWIWVFPVNKIKEVLALIGKPIKLDSIEAELANQYSEDKKKKITTGPTQGEGFIKVMLHPTKPNYFMVTTVRDRQPQNTNVSFETVQALWRVIKRQKKGVKVLTGTVAGNFCEELKIRGFNTYKDNKFNWKYFSGSRKHYLRFYAAIKVLADYEVIDHIVQASKSGIIKCRDNWELQTEL